ncbi:MAG: hypothetical protein K2W96_27255 [Gemmataceae bacterium]|nr:hypothetical protein [Gemmataceae bacterium]
MKTWNSLGCLTLLVAGVVRGQAPTSLPVPALLPPVASAPAAPAMDAPMPQPVGTDPTISSWLAYPRSPACCGPVGKNGPVMSEMYTRAGMSFTLGSGVINSRVNQPGLVLGLGWRTLLFNPAADRAWVIDLGISTTTFNDTSTGAVTLRNVPRNVTIPTTTAAGSTSTQTVQVIVPAFNVVPDGVNQTYFNLSIGRECYLWGNANCSQESRCRVGWDAGGRWGSTRFDLVAERHRTDTVGGFFLAAHTDLEIPCGCCIVQFGARGEYGYVWSDVLQSRNNTDLQTVSIMMTAGLRY